MCPPPRAPSFRLTTSRPRRRWENCRRVHAEPINMPARERRGQADNSRSWSDLLWVRSKRSHLTFVGELHPLSEISQLPWETAPPGRVPSRRFVHPVQRRAARFFSWVTFTPSVSSSRDSNVKWYARRLPNRPVPARPAFAPYHNAEIACMRWFTRQRKCCSF